MGRFNFGKMFIFHKLIYLFNDILIKMPIGFVYGKLFLVLKFVKKNKCTLKNKRKYLSYWI